MARKLRHSPGSSMPATADPYLPSRYCRLPFRWRNWKARWNNRPGHCKRNSLSWRIFFVVKKMIDPELVRRAAAGDRQALELAIERIQDKVYGFAVRMLWNPEDARDATQEIL